MTPTYPARTLDAAEPQSTSWLRVVYAVEPVAAVVALLILAPVGLAIGIAIIALSGRGPLIRHRRAGWRGVELPMLKFRTMWGDDEPYGSLFAIDEVSGIIPVSKTAEDERVTSRFAAFCRRYSLDELPQLLHVVRGQMSLVGPRPITFAELEEHYGTSVDEVLSMRPGITGLWQVLGRNRLNYARRKRLDLWLVRRISASLYLEILRRSVACVFSGRDAC